MYSNYEFEKVKISEIVISNNILYSVEKIDKIFHEDYLYNLKKMLTEEKKHMTFKWYSIDELGVTERKKSKEFTEIVSNSYLKRVKDKRVLALDIMENGTYFPLSVIHNNTFKNEVFKGSHRIISAKLLQQEGKWNDKKFLALDYTEHVDKTIWEFYSKNRPLEGDNMYRVPLIVLYPDMYSKGFYFNEMKEDIRKHGGELISSDIALVPMLNYRAMIKVLGYFGVWINELIYLNRDVTGECLKPSPIINSEEEFNKWLGW